MINTIEADIVRHVAANGGILVHQVNCQRVCGAGLAKQIATFWPKWEVAFKENDPHLGWYDVYQPQPYPRVWIASLYAQDGYGRTGVFTDLKALERAVKNFAKGLPDCMKGTRDPMPIYVPHGIGCGLGGEKWENVEPILIAHMPQPFTLVKLPERKTR